MLVEIQNAVFGYGGQPVVQVDQLNLHPGRCLGIFGPNGSGKTTLIRGLTGLIEPMEGTVRWRQPKARIGYLPQYRTMASHWPMTGLDAATIAISASNRFGWSRRSIGNVKQSMQKLGVLDLEARLFTNLSGGQQQRLLLAGALAAKPEMLVLDEPADGLDVQFRRIFLELLKSEKEAGLSIVIITHELQDLYFLSDDVANLAIQLHPGSMNRVELVKPESLFVRVRPSLFDGIRLSSQGSDTAYS